jgi:hydroxypyruvate reductase
VTPTGRPGEVVRLLFRGALARVAPAGPTARALAGLDLAGSIVLLATGKAALGMAAGAHAALAGRIADEVVVVPAGSVTGAASAPGPAGPSRPRVREASHPVPDARSEQAGRALLAAAARARPDQDLVALVSGGGSALTAVPAHGLELSDKAAAVARLMAAGAPIAELNCVRRHLSAIKGGRLARATPARVTTLVVSDVVGDGLAEVASGPTVPDPTTFADACDVIDRRIGRGSLPPAVRRHLDAGRRGLVPDGLASPRPGDRAILLLGLGALVEAAAAEARSAFDLARVEVVPERLEGPVEAVAAMLAERILPARPGLLVAGGEPTVILPPSPGRSGRAHQLALLLARALAGAPTGPDLAVLVAGSDGIDGTSDAAGAVVDRQTWQRIRAAGLDPGAHLAGCDAARALAAAGAQLKTGPTGVNHADLVLACSAPGPSR